MNKQEKKNTPFDNSGHYKKKKKKKVFAIPLSHKHYI